MTTEERLERLERELRRANRIIRCLAAGALLCLGVGLAAWARPQPGEAQSAPNQDKEIRSNRFVVEDKTGKPRIWMGINDQGPQVIVLSEDGRKRCVMGVAANGQALVTLGDGTGVHGCSLNCDKTSQGLLLFSEKDEACSLIQLFAEGDTSLNFYDTKGNVRSSFGFSKEGPNLRLLDEKQKIRASLGVEKTDAPDGRSMSYPESTLLLFGPDGKIRWQSP